ncbi:MAG: DUF4394 domain-containing protein [Phycisphaerales bacterium JB037]
MNVRKNLLVGAAALAGTAGFASAQVVYGVTSNETLVTWNAGSPNNVTSGVALSGFEQNETVRGIDFRPATGELFAVGSFSNLYKIDTSSGAATRVGSGSFSPGLNGSSFGFDFNPTIDRIRLVSEVNQNMVLNPNDGSSTAVTDLFYASGDVHEGIDPNVVASAYTNSFAGSTSTQLYGIDTGLDILVTQANSAGTLMTVGSLGEDLNDTASFDIFSDGTSNIAYATVQDDTLARSTFWTIDLTTGQASIVGEIGGGAVISAMAVTPAPASFLALAGGGALVGRRRRR